MMALNRCTVTDSLWNRYADYRSSWNLEEICTPALEGSQQQINWLLLIIIIIITSN